MVSLADRIAAMAEAQSKRSGVDRRYRLADCRTLAERQAMFARLNRDDAEFVEPLRLLTEVFGRGAIAQVNVVEGGSVEAVGVVPLSAVDVRRVDGRRRCYWADELGGDDVG